jgi:vacuolar protein sorting-associated protein 26
MAAFFGFSSPPVDIQIALAGEDERRQVEVKPDKGDKGKEVCPVYYDGESVVGQVSAVLARY